jgi:hypothetical protein
MALVNIRRLCREFNWSPEEVLRAPRQLVRDLVLVARLEHQAGGRSA